MTPKLPVLAGLVLAACSPASAIDENARIDPFARRYAELSIASEPYDEWEGFNFVGPSEWRKAIERKKMAQPAVRKEMIALMREFRLLEKQIKGSEPKRRIVHMIGNLDAMILGMDIQAGAEPSLEEETRRLYGMALQPVDPGIIPALKAELDAALPGPGSLQQRYAAHVARVRIPEAKFEQAIGLANTACREATVRRLPLPEDGGFRITLDRKSPSTGSMYYEGGFTANIALRPVAQSAMETLVLACHEGYPGHFVHSYIRERAANRTHWPELYVIPVRSALLDEGLAEFATDAAMTASQQRKVLAESLMPLAGIDPALAPVEQRVWTIANRLKWFAAAEAVRLLRSGKLDRAQMEIWLQENALVSAKSTRSFLRFVEATGAYPALYGPGLALVRRKVEAAGGTSDHPDKRWSIYLAMVEDVLR